MGGTKEIIKATTIHSTSIPPCSNGCYISDCDCDCCKGGQALCITNSVCNSVSTGSATVTIPANSCITKIYASMPNAAQNAKYIRIEVTSGSTTIFCHALPNQPGTGVVFDTTLVQPLCVGAEDATATVTALNQNNNQLNEILTLTVVYCPDCC
jgi:hypothetical protein